LPYSENEKFTDFKISSKAFSDRRVINLSSMTLIDRGNMILNKMVLLKKVCKYSVKTIPVNVIY
jgi:hypothetical protein